MVVAAKTRETGEREELTGREAGCYAFEADGIKIRWLAGKLINPEKDTARRDRMVRRAVVPPRTILQCNEDTRHPGDDKKNLLKIENIFMATVFSL